MVYYQDPINSSTRGIVGPPVITYVNMLNQPYFSTKPIDKTVIMRGIRLPGTYDDFTFTDATASGDPCGEAFYFTFDGCPASAVIGKIQVTFTYEFTPIDSAALICNTQIAAPGIATIPAISNLITEFPQI